ncbi:MAG: hypothetical protein P1U53_17860, partial [Sulfitobacter sp.]|nr:hypothetical protein [Sulfitobacter sp.]
TQFPATGGVIQIGDEKIRYAKRVGNMLRDLERGLDSSNPAAHDTTQVVNLKASDPWRQLIENTGNMAFMIAATDQDLAYAENRALSTDLNA